jgi:glutathione synthase/RimK-type ligase-like ATP-grasp enzyme
MEKNGIVLFLGALRHGEFESLLSRGISCGALIDSNTKLHLPDLARFQVVERFDFLRPEAELLGKLREIQSQWGLRCLINVVEHYVAVFARVAPELGLPAISRQSAQLCLDKSAMRRRFVERIGPQSTGQFEEVQTEEQLRKFAVRVGFPLVLKPTNLSASLFISLNHTQDELLASYRRLIAEVPRYYQQAAQKGKKLAIQVEEFMAGSNHSIDCWVDAKGHASATPVVDVLTGKDVGIDDFHHFARITPSQLSREEEAEASRLAMAGAQALDMSTVIGHVEFIQTPAGPRLLEIGARPGGNRIRILEMTYGIDQIFAYYQILCGGSPEMRREKEQPSAIVTPFPRCQGILSSFHGLDRLEKLPTYCYHEVRGRVGQKVGLAKDGFKAPLYIELTAPTRDGVRRDVDRIASWNDLIVVQ